MTVTAHTHVRTCTHARTHTHTHNDSLEVMMNCNGSLAVYFIPKGSPFTAAMALQYQNRYYILIYQGRVCDMPERLLQYFTVIVTQNFTAVIL